MQLPWHGKTGLAQVSAFLATVLTISLGLCGANFLAYQHWGNYESAAWWPSGFLFFAAIAESIAIVGSLAVLIIVWFILLVQWVEARISSAQDRKGKA